MFNRQSGKSLEDTIRDVHNRYKNRPSPLQNMQENIGFAPTQVPDHMRAKSNDLRGNLLGAFKPNKDTFR
jgi:hypothetical protein